VKDFERSAFEEGKGDEEVSDDADMDGVEATSEQQVYSQQSWLKEKTKVLTPAERVVARMRGEYQTVEPATEVLSELAKLVGSDQKKKRQRSETEQDALEMAKLEMRLNKRPAEQENNHMVATNAVAEEFCNRFPDYVRVGPVEMTRLRTEANLICTVNEDIMGQRVPWSRSPVRLSKEGRALSVTTGFAGFHEEDFVVEVDVEGVLTNPEWKDFANLCGVQYYVWCQERREVYYALCRRGLKKGLFLKVAEMMRPIKSILSKGFVVDL